jgi:hypothetical protein
MAQDVAVAQFTLTEVQSLCPSKRVEFGGYKLKASTTYAQGQLVGPVTATPGTYALYASGNSDGSQVPEGYLKRACVTDANGLITFGAQTGGAYPFGNTDQVTSIVFSDVVNVADLAGLDSTAITALLARKVSNAKVLLF